MPTKDGNHAYTEEEKAEIIAHVLVNVACGRPVDRIFREDDMTGQGIVLPAQSTFWLWLFADDTNELSEKLVRAREFGIEALLDGAIDMAGTPMLGEEITIERDPEQQKELDEGGTITDRDGNPYEGMTVKVKKADMLGHRKLYIETIFKAAQMMKPKKYGPKLDLTSGGEKLSMADQVKRGQELARRMREAEGRGDEA